MRQFGRQPPKLSLDQLWEELRIYLRRRNDPNDWERKTARRSIRYFIRKIRHKESYVRSLNRNF